jgi:hypothetical protein
MPLRLVSLSGLHSRARWTESLRDSFMLRATFLARNGDMMKCRDAMVLDVHVLVVFCMS